MWRRRWQPFDIYCLSTSPPTPPIQHHVLEHHFFWVLVVSLWLDSVFYWYFISTFCLIPLIWLLCVPVQCEQSYTQFFFWMAMCVCACVCVERVCKCVCVYRVALSTDTQYHTLSSHSASNCREEAGAHWMRGGGGGTTQPMARATRWQLLVCSALLGPGPVQTSGPTETWIHQHICLAPSGVSTLIFPLSILPGIFSRWLPASALQGFRLPFKTYFLWHCCHLNHFQSPTKNRLSNSIMTPFLNISSIWFGRMISEHVDLKLLHFDWLCAET